MAKALAEIEGTGEPVEIERDGQTVAVIVSLDDYKLLARERFWRTVQELRHANLDQDPEAIEREITAAVEEVRQHRFETQRRAQSRP